MRIATGLAKTLDAIKLRFRLAQVIQKVEAVEAAGVAPGRVKLRVTMAGSFATVVV